MEKYSIGFISDAGNLDDQQKLIQKIRNVTSKLDAIYFNARDVTYASLEQWNNFLFDQILNINIKDKFLY